MAEDDQYSRFDYRRLIAWPARIEREWPLLERLLSSAPSKRVIDFGSGTGEHARFLVSKGFDVVGLDASESMVEKSREIATDDHVRFVQGDMRDAAQFIDGKFGAAICIGNVLPHLNRPEDLERFAASAASILESGAPLLVQILNYDRIEAKGERHLPVNFRPDPETGGTVVFFRLIDLHDDGTVDFYPSSLLLRPDRDPPLEVVGSKKVELRGWRAKELDQIFARAGFEKTEHLGGFDGSRFDREQSRDLLLVAWR
ncbi:MAG: class I SAM-dependent methyltransferase [Thermoanaerobaculia bacterium]|nr:class I SAM-dependent methyltransferase [Thermoanaerobaculia bacterium]